MPARTTTASLIATAMPQGSAAKHRNCWIPAGHHRPPVKHRPPIKSRTGTRPSLIDRFVGLIDSHTCFVASSQPVGLLYSQARPLWSDETLLLLLQRVQGENEGIQGLTRSDCNAGGFGVPRTRPARSMPSARAPSRERGVCTRGMWYTAVLCYNMVWNCNGTVWYDVLWYGIVPFRMSWHGTVWNVSGGMHRDGKLDAL